MKSLNKRKPGKSGKGCKKSFFVNVRFLIIVFAFIFTLLGAATVNVMAGTVNITPSDTKRSNSAAAPDYTTVFTFKNGNILSLTLESMPVTDYLVTSNQNAVTGFLVTDVNGKNSTDACVNVSIKPFIIKAVKVGEALVHLTAKMWDQSMLTITLKVIVEKENNDINQQTKDAFQQNPAPFYELRCKAVCDYASLKEFDFSLINQADNEHITDFLLFYSIIEGSVKVSIANHTANLIFTDQNKACKIKFSAVLDTDVTEFLFVNS